MIHPFKSIAAITIVVITMLLVNTSNAQSYDYSVTNIEITNPTGYVVGSSIPIGTALNELRFSIGNSGSSSIPSGATVTVDLSVGTSTIPLTGTLAANLAPNASTTFVIDCSAAGINYDFPNASGFFNICVNSTYTNDPNSSNNQLCNQYRMTSSSSGFDLSIMPGSINVTNPVGINQGGTITTGTPLNEVQFEIENTGSVVVSTGTSVTIELDIAGIKKNANLSFSAPIAVGSSTTITANVTSTGLDMDFPTSNGPFDICATVFSPSDVNASNNKSCQGYTLGALPTITSMTPTSGPIGTQVTINGTDFPTSGNVVEFSPGVNANIVSNTSTQIVVNVPNGAVTGKVELLTNGLALNAGVFTIATSTGHTITALSPNGGMVGDEIKIQGTKFNTNANMNFVTFSNGVVANVKSATPTELVVDVPNGAVTGIVTVRINGVNALSPQAFTVFTVPTMVITNFTPKKAAIGQEVTISGDLFNSAKIGNTVTFTGGAVATVTYASPQVLRVTVPTGAQDGYFTVNNGTSTATSPQIFEVENGPLITELTPNMGKAGSSMTIKGYNFSTTATDNTVLFGSLNAGVPIVNSAGTELEVTVPPGLSTGEHTVRLIVLGFPMVTSEQKYTVVLENVGIIEELNYNSMKFISVDKGVEVRIESATFMKDAYLIITDMKGALVQEIKLNAEGTLNHNVLISDDFESGVYLFTLINQGDPAITKKYLLGK